MGKLAMLKSNGSREGKDEDDNSDADLKQSDLNEMTGAAKSKATTMR